MAIFRSGRSGLLLPGTPRPVDLRDIVVPDGLVRYWPLDVDSLKSATVQADFTGVADGTLGAAPPVLAEGQIGKCYSFPGGTTSYIDSSVNAGIVIGSTFSVSLWAKATTTQTFGTLITTLDATPFDGIEISWAYGNAERSKHFITDGSATIRTETTNAKTLNVWYHIAATYDGSNNQSGLFAYENGQLVAQSQTGSPPVGAFTNRPWRIGNERTAVPANGFIGFIDDVRVYNRALSPAEIGAIYVSGLQGSRDQAALGIEFSGWGDDPPMFLPASTLGANVSMQGAFVCA